MKQVPKSTFNTPFGKNRFQRLPFGINIAPEIFQRHMANLFEGIEGVMDEVLIYGRTENEHDVRVKRSLQILKEQHVELNQNKCKASEVT